MTESIPEKVRRFVEAECNKPTSHYGSDPYEFHFVPTHKYAVMLAEKQGADVEIVEIAAWFHDIGSILKGREDHHIEGVKIAEDKLRDLGYPEDRIKRVAYCIFVHRGSMGIKPQTIEAKILIDADTLSNFDNVSGIIQAAIQYENKNLKEVKEGVFRKLTNKWNQLSPEARELIKDKYEAVKVLFG